ncbi:MAG: rRNA maturation RNase YbeY [Nocardioidaceae bacterium]
MSVDVINESGADVDVVDFSRLARFVLERMRIHPQAEMAVKFVDMDEMSRLNELWMDKQGPTDVLAFPIDELRPGHAGSDPPDGVVGDVVLAPEVAAKQAADAGHTAVDEMHLLAVHGILHLLGYDHAEPTQHREMFGLQARLLAEWQGVRRGEDVEP